MGNSLSCFHGGETKVPGRKPPEAKQVSSKQVASKQAVEAPRVSPIVNSLSSWPEGVDPDAVQPLIQPDGMPWDLGCHGVHGPPNDEERRLTGKALGLFSAPRSEELDLVLSAVRRVFDAPYSVIALYYNRCCWLTNSQGGWGEGYLAWKVSACPWNCLVTQPQTIVCGELHEDARFHHQPWADGGLRCYVSAPLLASNGHRLGTICFMDNVPRRVDAGMCRVLNNFGEISVRILERHVKLAARLIAANQQVPASLGNLVEAAETGRDVREFPEGKLLQGLDEGLWEEEEVSGPNAGIAVAGKPPAKPPLPADTLLTSVFNRQLRSSEAVQDACCLVVDTGMPGWPVLYADETWKLWSGLPRTDLMGHKLQDFLAPATPGVAPLNWAALQREVDAGERFVVPCVVIAPRDRRESLQMLNTSVAGNCNYMRKGSSAGKADRWPLSAATVHDLDMAPRLTHKGGTPPASEQFSVDALVSLTPIPQGVPQPDPGHMERLIDAVASHEAGKGYMLAGQSTAAGSGVEMWHEAAGLPLHPSNGSIYSTPAASGSNAFLAAPPSGSSKAFDLSFRPMALDVLDADALPLGVPSWVPLEACAPMLRLYAVRLHATTAAPMPAQPLTPAVKVTRLNSSLAQLAGHLFPDLSVGQVLGRGGYGTAYTGTWHDVAVVVKVQDHMLEDMESLHTAQLEVAMGQMLRHPYLVRTLAHGAAEVAPTPPSAVSGHPSQAATPAETSRAERRPSTADASGSRAPVYSGFSPLSKWLYDKEEEWDNFGANSWFSHCSDDGLVHRSLLSTQAPAAPLTDWLPSPAQFINAVAVAPDIAAVVAAPVEMSDVPPLRTAPGADNPTRPIKGEAFRRQQTSGLLAALQAGQALPAAPGGGGRAPTLGQDAQIAGINYMPVAGVPGPQTAREAAWRGLSGAFAQAADVPDSAASGSTAQLEAELLSGPHARAGAPVAPASAQSTMSSSFWSTLGSVPAKQRLDVEMAAMMESGQQHASRAGAKPMQFPMHLRTFAILEYCDGGTLSDTIDRGWMRKGTCHMDSPPDMLKIVRVAGNIACGAAYLHGRGVVHADLSAANVLLCSNKPMVARGHDARLTGDTIAPRRSSVCTVTGQSACGNTESANRSSQQSAQSSQPLSSVMSSDATKSCETNTGHSADEDPGYTLPTRRYSLAAPTARKAEELQFIAKISDFGKSCLLGPEGVIKAGGYATVTHMAPEVLREHLISPAADVYALGVLLWQMYTGSRPWAGLNHKQILVTVLSGELHLEWPASIVSDLPPVQQQAAARLTVLGRACLAHDAAARPTMAAVGAELASLVRLLEEADE